MISNEAILICVNMFGIYWGILSCRIELRMYGLLVGFVAIVFNFSMLVINLYLWLELA